MKKTPLILSIALVSGCHAWQPLQNANLFVRPEVVAGNLKTQTVTDPYTQASINHLVLKLYTDDGSEHDTGIFKSLLNAQLNNTIAFSNLKNNTTYRIRAYAYTSSTEDSTTLISSDVDSYVDVVIGTNDRPTLTNIPVKLINRLFNGQATSSLSIISGGYSPVASEGVALPKVITTLAGNGTQGYTDALGTSATFNQPIDVAVDTQGSLYIADSATNRIRKVYPSGMVITFAGNGIATWADGTGTAASFNTPSGIAIDSSGNVFAAEKNNQRIRKITPTGVVTTFAGNGNVGGSDGTGTAATFNYPAGLDIDAAGNLYVPEYLGNRIRKITPTGVVSTLAGNGATGYADGTGTVAAFNCPQGVAVDALGNVYVADRYNHRIRKVTSTGSVTTLAGNGTAGAADGTGSAATFNCPVGIALDPQGNIYVATYVDNRIHKVTQAGVVTTIVGSGVQGSADGTGTAATLSWPHGITFDAFGTLYLTDYASHRIRVIK